MTDHKPKDSFKGSKYTVIHCDGALDSYIDALSRVNPGKHKSFTRQMILQIERLANGGRMTNENFPQEGDLPKRNGQHNTKKFRALKRIPIRGYCWLSERHKDTYYISHYVYKDYDKLKDSDVKKVGNNWVRIEENGDER